MRNFWVAMVAAAALAMPATAKQVTCADGTTAKAGRGACSHHGGVAADKADKKTDSAEAKPASRKAADAKEAKSAEAKTEGKRAEAKSSNDAGADKRSGGGLGGLFGRRGNDTPRSATRGNSEKSGTPTARCKDGTMSYSAHHSGSCSGHGGVAEWLDK